MQSLRTLLALGSTLGLVAMLACKNPEPTPEPTPVKTDTKTEVTPTETKSSPTDTTRPVDMSAAQRAEFEKAARAALQDINFDFDRSDIREGDKGKLQGIASFMKKFAAARIMIEGHCDERGTVEYNLALGERRASAAQSYLTGLGVAREHMNTISYGKEKPKVMGQNEESWFVNRRDEFKIQN